MNQRLTKTKWEAQWIGHEWERMKPIYDHANLTHILQHLPTLPPGPVLEIGGGPSYLAFALAKMGRSVVSLDQDAGILGIARAGFAQHHCPAGFVCGDIAALPFRERAFAVTVGIGVLEHAGSFEVAVQELARVTRPGGVTFQNGASSLAVDLDHSIAAVWYDSAHPNA